METQWEVDYHKTTDIISMYINIFLYKAPCRIVSVDVLDFVGSEMHDVKLHHKRLDKDGKVEGHSEEYIIDKNAKFDLEELSKEAESWPGCQIWGSFPVRKAPGNFHISFHSYFQFYDYLVNRKGLNINMEHKLETLRLMGDNEDVDNNHTYQAYAHNYDKDFYKHSNAVAFNETEDKKGRFVAQHFLNIYPVKLWHHRTKENFEFHKYTFVKKFKTIEEKEKQMPMLEYKLKFLPFMETVNVMANRSMGRVIINIFAICGGVFAVFSLIQA